MFRLILVAIVVFGFSGCSADAGAEDDGRLRVVASTDVYGDIVSTLAGDLATVTSIIEGAGQDPHSYEPTARDLLAVSKADLVIFNGGGYDPFVAGLVEAADVAEVVTAVEASGLVMAAPMNEHVWYSFAAVRNVADELASVLAAADPANSAAYGDNAAKFSDALTALETRAATLREHVGGSGIAVTELVPQYLLEDVGLVDRTPGGFAEAIEEGSDVSPALVEETLALFSSGEIEFLAYNEQTAGPQTERVRMAAEASGVPVVLFTETLPDGADYISWMAGNLDALSAVLER